MFKNYLRGPVLLAVAAAAWLLLAPQQSYAQRWGVTIGGRGGSISFGNAPRYGYGGYGYGSGYRPYSTGYYGYYPGYRSYSYSPNYYYTPDYYSYQQPAPSGYQSFYPKDSSASLGNAAELTILVPDPDTQVWFDDTLMRDQNGTRRVYVTPPLESGRQYTYQIRARWTQSGQPMDQARAVPVQAGRQVTVDFNQQIIPTGAAAAPANTPERIDYPDRPPLDKRSRPDYSDRPPLDNPSRVNPVAPAGQTPADNPRTPPRDPDR